MMHAPLTQTVSVRRLPRVAATMAMGLMLLGLAAQSATAAVLKVRFGGDQTQTRMVIELDQADTATGATVEDGRLVLRFDRLDLAAEQDGRGLGLVDAWRLDQAGGGGKLSLQLTRPATIVRRFLLPPGEGVRAYRYVVDLAAAGTTAPPPAPTGVVRVSAPRKPVADRPLTLRKVIVIDAGHGGHDPGAMGVHSREKDVTLAAAKALKARLERDGRYKVVLTRDRDVFVPLESRVQIARQANASLFISLHADSAQDPQTRGATVYTLSDKGTDRAARSVFDQPSSFINVDLPGHDRAVKQILLDLTQRATKNESGAFAEVLLDHVSPVAPLLQRSHRDAGYVVLLAPDVPAVLLEMGFISNSADESALSDDDRREALMGAVGDSIDAYFARQVRYAAR